MNAYSRHGNCVLDGLNQIRPKAHRATPMTTVSVAVIGAVRLTGAMVVVAWEKKTMPAGLATGQHVATVASTVPPTVMRAVDINAWIRAVTAVSLTSGFPVPTRAPAAANRIAQSLPKITHSRIHSAAPGKRKMMEVVWSRSPIPKMMANIGIITKGQRIMCSPEEGNALNRL